MSDNNGLNNNLFHNVGKISKILFPILETPSTLGLFVAITATLEIHVYGFIINLSDVTNLYCEGSCNQFEPLNITFTHYYSKEWTSSIAKFCHGRSLYIILAGKYP